MLLVPILPLDKPGVRFSGEFPGSVTPGNARCGKANCTCAPGESHRPTGIGSGVRMSVLHKEYVRTADLTQVRAACDAFAADVREGRGLLGAGRTLITQIRRDKAAGRPAVLDMWTALYLIEDMEDYFWEKKGTLMQRLKMFAMEEDIYHLACGNKHRNLSIPLLAHILPHSRRSLRNSPENLVDSG